MTRWVATLTLSALCLAPLHADVKVVQTLTMEGALAGTVGAGGAMPTLTMRVKGMKARFDMELQGKTATSIADLATKQVIFLDATTKKATYFTGDAQKAGEVAAALAKIDFNFKPTSQKKKIEGVDADEYGYAVSINLMELMPQQQQMSPEAAEALKDLRIMGKGSLWVAQKGPGASEFTAFMKAALDANVLGPLLGGGAATANGFDRFLKAAASAPGLPYLHEVTMTVEGTSPVVGMLQAMGPLKLVQKTTAVSTEPLSDDLFKIPEGYTVEKK
jgi:hypothetical protein